MCARGPLDVRRERPGPLGHPRHRHAREERALGTLMERRRAWMGVAKAAVSAAIRRARRSRSSGAAVGHPAGCRAEAQLRGHPAPRDRGPRVAPLGQLIWRTNPQMWQVAVPVSGSSSRKLAQPLVPQKRRLVDGAAKVRRRIRRMAEDRPVTDDVVERDIMVRVVCAFWRAVIAYERSAARPGCRPGAFAQDDYSLMCLRAGPGAWFGRSNRVVASDGLPKKYRRSGRFRQTADGPGLVRRPGAVRPRSIAVSSPNVG